MVGATESPICPILDVYKRQVQRRLQILRVMDLSATPFFLRGSGYVEGTLFPWTMSDFSLMDAIECGIVKLPRVPVAENIPGNELPMFRNLWEHIRKDMPKKGRKTTLDPLALPVRLQTALEADVYKRQVLQWWHGFFTPEVLGMAMYGTPGVMLGSLAAFPVVKRINVLLFRRVLLAIIAICGVVCLVRSIW